MQILKWIVFALSLFQGAWLTFDGSRAMIVGNYVTASSGPRAGQLGPWSRIVSAIGFDPRSRLIKGVHVILGIAWLVSAVLFVMRPPMGWWAVLFCSVASIWYLPIGTVLSAISIVMLLTSSLRNAQ
jgi:hypothetical protein